MLADSQTMASREEWPIQSHRCVTPGCTRKVWWKCAKRHEWRATSGNRTRRSGSGCRYCSGRLATPKTSLKALFPETAKQWHPTKNGKLKPADVLPRSNKKVWWRCAKKREWQTHISHRTGPARAGCPCCSGAKATAVTSLKRLYPKIEKHWHPTKNGKLRPTDVRPGSEKKVWWQCTKKHEWQATVYQRTRRCDTGCPYCSGKRVTAATSLKGLFPKVARQWHPKKNSSLKPSEVFPKSGKSA